MQNGSDQNRIYPSLTLGLQNFSLEKKVFKNYGPGGVLNIWRGDYWEV